MIHHDGVSRAPQLFVRVILHANMNSSSTEPIIEVSVQLSRRELLKASKVVTRIASARFLIFLSVISAFSIAFGVFLGEISTGHRPLPPSLYRLPLFWMVFFPPLLLLALFYGTPYLSARNAWKNSPNVRVVSHYSFSEREVTIQLPTARAQLQWSSFLRARETSDFFLLYVRESMLHMLPKRAFTSDNEVAAFRTLLRNQIKSASLRG
jgi:hypothetical protein